MAGDAELRAAHPNPEAIADEALVRTFLGIVVHRPADAEHPDAERLSKAELESLTAADLDAFSAAFFAANPLDETDGKESLISRLAEKLREAIKSLESSRQKASESLKKTLSAGTIDLIKQTSSYAEELRRMAEGTSFSLKDLKPLTESMKTPLDFIRREMQEREEMIRSVGGASTLQSRPVSPIPFGIEIPETPAQRTAEAVDEALSMFKVHMKEMSSFIDTIISAVVDWQQKRDDDAKQVKRNIWIAAASLVVAAISLIVGAWFGFLSWRVANQSLQHDLQLEAQARIDDDTKAKAAQDANAKLLATLESVRDELKTTRKSIASSPANNSGAVVVTPPWAPNYQPPAAPPKP